MTNEIAHQLAERFWNLCNKREGFPRSLDRAIVWSVPLLVIRLPRLGVAVIRAWLEAHGVPMRLPPRDRRLMGCLLARAGVGVVFLDGGDPDDEQRYSLAHELAHFLLDYLWPREAALAAMGEEIYGVLDGLRRPTPAERLNAVLRGVKLGPYTHLMNRDDSGWIARAEALEAEDRADRLALELVAPHRQILARAKLIENSAIPALRIATTVEMLIAEFGLTRDASERYANHLLGRVRGHQSFREWLGISSIRERGK